MSLCRWICKRLCGMPYEEPKTADFVVPPQLREASHILNNEVMVFQNSLNRLKATSDALSDIVNHMEGHPS